MKFINLKKKMINRSFIKKLSAFTAITAVMCLGFFAYSNFINANDNVEDIYAAATLLYTSPDNYRFYDVDLVTDRFGNPARYDISKQANGTIYANVFQFHQNPKGSDIIWKDNEVFNCFGINKAEPEYFIAITGGQGAISADFNIFKYEGDYYQEFLIDSNKVTVIDPDDSDWRNFQYKNRYSNTTELGAIPPWLQCLTDDEISKITTGVISKELTIFDANYLFAGLSNLENVRFDISNGVKKKITKMDGLFMGTGIKTVDFTNIDSSTISSFQLTFLGCKNLEYIDLTQLKGNNSSTLNKGLRYMFYDCPKLKSLDFSSWTNAEYGTLAFVQNDINLEYIDMSSFDYSSNGNKASIKPNIEANISLKGIKIPYNCLSNYYELPTGTWGIYASDGTRISIADPSSGSETWTTSYLIGANVTSFDGTKNACYLLKEETKSKSLSELELGDVVSFGMPNDSNLNERYKWRVVAFKDLDEDDTTGEDGKESPLFMLEDWYSEYDTASSKKLVSRTVFDSRADNAYDPSDFVNTHLEGRSDANGAFDEGDYTPNRYATSDIRKFLNSDAESNLEAFDDGYTASISNNAISSKGFLANFGQDKNYLREVPIKTISGYSQIEQGMYSGGTSSYVPQDDPHFNVWTYAVEKIPLNIYNDESTFIDTEITNYNKGYYETTYDKVFLPSLLDMHDIYQNSISEENNNGWRSYKYKNLARVNSTGNELKWDQGHIRSFWLRDAGSQTTVGTFVYDLSEKNYKSQYSKFWRASANNYFTVKMKEVRDSIEDGMLDTKEVRTFDDEDDAEYLPILDTDYVYYENPGTTKAIEYYDVVPNEDNTVDRFKTGIVPCCYLKEGTEFVFDASIGAYAIDYNESNIDGNKMPATPVALEPKYSSITSPNEVACGMLIENPDNVTITHYGYQVSTSDTFESTKIVKQETLNAINDGISSDGQKWETVIGGLKQNTKYYIRTFLSSQIEDGSVTVYSIPVFIKTGRPIIINRYGVEGSSSSTGSITFGYRVLSLMGREPTNVKLLVRSIGPWDDGNEYLPPWKSFTGGKSVPYLHYSSLVNTASYSDPWVYHIEGVSYNNGLRTGLYKIDLSDSGNLEVSTTENPVVHSKTVNSLFYHDSRYLSWIVTEYENEKNQKLVALENFKASNDNYCDYENFWLGSYSYYNALTAFSHFFNWAPAYTGEDTYEQNIPIPNNIVFFANNEVRNLDVRDTSGEYSYNYNWGFKKNSSSQTSEYRRAANGVSRTLLQNERFIPEDKVFWHEYTKLGGELGPSINNGTYSDQKKYAITAVVKENTFFNSEEENGMYFTSIPENYFEAEGFDYGQVIYNDAFTPSGGNTQINGEEVPITIYLPRLGPEYVDENGMKYFINDENAVEKDINGNPCIWDISENQDGSLMAVVFKKVTTNGRYFKKKWWWMLEGKYDQAGYTNATVSDAEDVLVIYEGNLKGTGEKIEFTHYASGNEILPVAGTTNSLDGVTPSEIRESENEWITDSTYQGTVSPWTLYLNPSKITQVVISDDVYLTDYSGLFAGLTGLESGKCINVNPFGYDEGREPSNMKGMFNGCTNLENVDLSKFNFTSLTNEDNAEDFFKDCTAITRVDLPKGIASFDIEMPINNELSAYDETGNVISSLGTTKKLIASGTSGAVYLASNARKPIYTDKDGFDYFAEDVYHYSVTYDQTYSGEAIFDISNSQDGSINAYIFAKKKSSEPLDVDPNSNDLILVIDGNGTKAKTYTHAFKEWVSNENVFKGYSFTTDRLAGYSNASINAIIPWSVYLTSNETARITEAGITKSVDCNVWDGWFWNLTNLTYINIELKNGVKKSPTSMCSTFAKCGVLNIDDVMSKIDTTKVTTMLNAFQYTKFETFPWQYLKGDSLTNFGGAFYNSNLTNVDTKGLNINFNKVTKLSYAFYNIQNLLNLDLSGITTSNKLTIIQDMVKLTPAQSNLGTLVVDIRNMDFSGVTSGTLTSDLYGNNSIKVYIPKAVPESKVLALPTGKTFYIYDEDENVMTNIGTNGMVTKLYGSNDTGASYITAISDGEDFLSKINSATSDQDIYHLFTYSSYSLGTKNISFLDPTTNKTVSNKFISLSTLNENVVCNYIWNKLLDKRAEEPASKYETLLELYEDLDYVLTSSNVEKLTSETIYVDYNGTCDYVVGGVGLSNTDKYYITKVDDYGSGDDDFIEVSFGNNQITNVTQQYEVTLYKTLKNSTLITGKIELSTMNIIVNMSEEYILSLVNNSESEVDLVNRLLPDERILEYINSNVLDTGFVFNDLTASSKDFFVIHLLYKEKEKQHYISIVDLANDIKLAYNANITLKINGQTGNVHAIKNRDVVFSVLDGLDDKIKDIIEVSYQIPESKTYGWTFHPTYVAEHIESLDDENYMVYATEANVGDKESKIDDYKTEFTAAIQIPQSEKILRSGTVVNDSDNQDEITIYYYWSGEASHPYRNNSLNKASFEFVTPVSDPENMEPSGTLHITSADQINVPHKLNAIPSASYNVFYLDAIYNQESWWGHYEDDGISRPPLGDSRIYFKLPKEIEVLGFKPIDGWTGFEKTITNADDSISGQYSVKISFKDSDITAYGEGLASFYTNVVTLSVSNVTLDESDVTFPDITSFTYDGNAHYIEEIINPDKAGFSYTAEYHKGSATGEVIAKENIKDVGTYYLAISVNPNTVGPGSTTSWSKSFNIVQKSMELITVDDSSVLNAEYTGSEIDPSSGFVIKDGDTALDPSTYTITYEDSNGNPVTKPKDVGTYTVVISDKTGNYVGTKEFTFTVVLKQITITDDMFDSNINLKLEKVYDGLDSYSFETNVNVEGVDVPLIVNVNFGNKNVSNNKTVTLTVSFKNSSDATSYGLSKTSITKANGKITPKPLTYQISVNEKTYDGTKSATGVAVRNSYVGLVSGDNPTITLSNGEFSTKDAGENITATFDAAIDDSNYSITQAISGEGNIKKKDLHIDATTDDGEYEIGDPITVHFALRNSDLVTGESVGLSTNSGSGVVEESSNKRVKKVNVNSWPTLTGGQNVIKNYNEVHSDCFVNLTRIDLSNERLEITIVTRDYFDGTPKEVNVSIKFPELGVTLIKDRDFTFEYLDDHTDLGSHDIKITFIGEYKGEKTASFEIKEKPAPTPSGGGGGGGGGVTYTVLPKEEIVEMHLAFMKGYEDKTFRPQDAISREEVATIVARCDSEFNEDFNFTSHNTFPDVDTRWSKNYIGFCKLKDLVHGYEDGSFGPTRYMTRAELATLVNNFLRVQNASFDNVDLTKPAFSDVDGRWYEESVNKLAALGILNGYEDGTFRGDNYVTRIEVTIVMNKINKRTAFDEIPDEYVEKITKVFKDVTPNRWFFKDVAESVIDHPADLY